MIKRRLWIVLMCVVVLAFTGCGGKNKIDKEVSGDVSENEYVTENESVLENETVTENEKVTEETQKTDNKKDNTTTNTETNKNNTTTNKNESTSNKNETTGNNNTTTKPSTGSTGNSGSTGNTQNNNGGTTTQPSTPVHEHTWVEITKTVDVAEVGHYEDIYDWRTLCGKCNVDMTDFTDDELTLHSAIICRSGYSTHYIKVGEKWVVDTPASTKQEVTGYKCECGATKGK